MDLNHLLIDSIKQMGIQSPIAEEKLIQAFEIYMKELLDYNAHTNLTAITEPEEIYTKHFVDSISAILALDYLEKNYAYQYRDKKYIDVGTGAGFPAVPVKILLEDMDLTLLDSLEKRTKFLAKLVEATGLEKVTILHQRAEDAARSADKREQYDLVLSRAVANLPVLLEYCLPFIKVGGYMVCLKGPSLEEEIAKSGNALKILGGKVEKILDVDLPFSDLNHKILIIQKVKKTGKAYPRKAGKPSKEPL